MQAYRRRMFVDVFDWKAHGTASWFRDLRATAIWKQFKGVGHDLITVSLAQVLLVLVREVDGLCSQSAEELYCFRRIKMICMIWYDMIWYDMIWYGYGYGYDMIWYDMIWYGYDMEMPISLQCRASLFSNALIDDASTTSSPFYVCFSFFIILFCLVPGGTTRQLLGVR